MEVSTSLLCQSNLPYMCVGIRDILLHFLPKVINFSGDVLPSQVIGERIYFPVMSPGFGINASLYLRRKECFEEDHFLPKGALVL